MNIGIFTDTYRPQINGVVTSIRMLEKELNKLNHKVYIFTTTDPNAETPLPRVFRLPSMPFIFLPSTRLALLYPPKLLFKIRMLKLDIIHTQTEFPLGILGKAVSELTKVPLIHTYHTMYEDYVHYVAKGHLITPKMAQQYSRIFCNRANTVIAPARKTKECLLDYGVVRPIEVVPTGIDFEPFSRDRFSKGELDSLRDELRLKETDHVVVSIGRVAKEKSLDVIINQFPKLLQKLPNAKLVIVGDGPYRQKLEELSKSLNINDAVRFAGFQPWDSLGKYYQLGDIFVTASTSETQGLTYIEAMAAGTCVVAKKDRSIEDILIDKKTGYSFIDDSEAADTMFRAITETNERKVIIENAQIGIQHLSSGHFAKSMEAIYLQAIENNKTSKRSRIKIKEDIREILNKKA